MRRGCCPATAPRPAWARSGCITRGCRGEIHAPSPLYPTFEYNAWANKRILDAAKGLAPELFTAPTRFSYPSLRATLVHMLFAEWVWHRRLMGASPLRSDKLIAPEDFPNLASLRAAWEQEAQAMSDYLQALEEQDLAASFKYTSTYGDAYEAVKANILTHMVMHAMQHRSEAAQMLTEYGHSPGDIDYVQFIREQADLAAV